MMDIIKIQYVGILLVFIWNLLLLLIGITAEISVNSQIYEQPLKNLTDCNPLLNSVKNTAPIQIFEASCIIITYVLFWYAYEGFSAGLLGSRKNSGWIISHFIMVQYFIEILVAVAYHGTSDFCHDVWSVKFPELWMYIMIEYGNLWINIIVTIILICHLFLPMSKQNNIFATSDVTSEMNH